MISDQPSRVVNQLIQAFDKAPNKIAIVDGHITIDYATLKQHVVALSTLLHNCKFDSDVEKPPIAAILCEHNRNLVTSIIASVVSGFAYQPIESDAPIQRTKVQLETSRASILFHSRGLVDRAREISTSAEVNLVCIEDVLESGFDHNMRLLSSAMESSPAYYLSTSGSTGVPKGVLHDNFSLWRTTFNYCDDMDIIGDDLVALAQPCVFTPSVFSIFGALTAGATLCIFDLKNQSIGQLAEWIDAQGITVVNCSTTVFRRLISTENICLDSLKSMYVAGEPMYRSDLARYKSSYAHKFALYNGMGTTEISCFARYPILADTELKGELVPIGQPYDDVEALILNSDGDCAKANEEGELYVIGHYIPGGYFNRSDLSEESFLVLSDGRMRYRTGDRAKMDENGDITHLGRLDGQVKIRGQRVELTEVEAALLDLNAISECFVNVSYDENTHENTLSAFFVPAISSGVVREHLCKTLPVYMVPTNLIGLEQMPTNSSGKVDRMFFKNFDWSSHSSDESPISLPEDIVQTRILECFKETLGLESLGIDSNFFECGGDSLKATQAADLIQKHLAIAFPVSNLMSEPTPRRLAIEARRLLKAGDSRYLVKFGGTPDEPDSNEQEPIFCLPGLFGDALSFRALASEMLTDRPIYAFEYPGYDGSKTGYDTVEELAEICLKEIQRVYPEGPVILLSYSAGGVVAFELARQLRCQNREIKSLIMMDCYSPLSLKMHRFRDSIVGTVKSIIRSKLGDDRTNMERIRDFANDMLTRAIARYSAQPQALDHVTLLLAEEAKKPFYLFDNFKNWNDLYSKGIQRRKVSGDHYSLVMPHKAKEMYREITHCLRSV